MSDKIYLGAGKVVQTKNGPMLVFAFSKEDIEKLWNNMNDQGWVNVNVGKRKQISDKGVSHYMAINDWKPENNQGSGPGGPGGPGGGQPGGPRGNDDEPLPW